MSLLTNRREFLLLKKITKRIGKIIPLLFAHSGLFLLLAKSWLNSLKNCSLLFIKYYKKHSISLSQSYSVYKRLWYIKYLYFRGEQKVHFLLTSRLPVASLRRILEITSISDNSYLRRGFFVSCSKLYY